MSNQDGSHSDKAIGTIREKGETPICRCHELNDCEQTTQQEPCCGGGQKTTVGYLTEFDKNDHWIIGEIETSAGILPQIATDLVLKDTIGSLKVRLGINRMNYKVNPGLYGVGIPDGDSPVLVTANYKLSFDALRKELSEINAWILVLDTKGINVWCASGKGTFGTEELVSRIAKTGLSEIVSHRKIIVPQLGAPGLTAHDITIKSGFSVIYGPVRTKDIKDFVDAGMKATEAMRKVNFNLYDRFILTPIELVGTLKQTLMIFGVLFLMNLIARNPFGILDVYAYLGAIIIGCVLTPVLLPYIPGSSFAWKGWILGFIWAVGINLLNNWTIDPSATILRTLGYLFILPAIASYYAMNFTGSSTYTSFSGVQKEMKIAVPLLAFSLSIGVILILVNSFFTF